MKKTIILTFLFSSLLLAQNLYFKSFVEIRTAKRIMNTNPQKAKKLFLDAYKNLTTLVNDSIRNKKPSSNGMFLLGEMYLNGWGIPKNVKEANILICNAKKLGNLRAERLVKKLGISCKK